MNLKKWLTLILLTIFAAFVLAACGDSEGTSSDDSASSNESSSDNNATSDDNATDDSDPIRIGVVTTLSGPYGEIGQEMLDGIQVAVDEANEAGGVLGRKVELVIEDDEVQPDVAIRKAEKMVLDEGINLFFGSVASGVTLALQENMPQWESLLVTSIPKSVALTESADNSNFFRVNHNDNQDVLAIGHWMKNGDISYEKFYFVGADYEWGHDLIGEMKAIVEEIGGENLGEEFTPLGTSDYSTVLTNARSKNPDVIIAAYAGGDGAAFLSQVQSFGIVDDGIDVVITPMGDSLARANPELTKGIFGAANYHHSLDFEKNVAFVEKFESANNYKPTNFSGEAYASAWMLFDAIEATGNTNVDELIATLEGNFTFDSVMGEITVDPETHQVLHPNYIGEFYENTETGQADIRIIHTVPTEDANPR